VYVNEIEKDDSINKIYDQSEKIQQIPILKKGAIVDVIFRDDLNGDKIPPRNFNLPVVIMAGGKGTRLDPFTRILPKSLIPIGNEPIIKVIMDKFKKFGVDNFYVSLNDKGRMIKAYFHDHDLRYHIKYIEEDKPLGTAGALKYLDGKLQTPFIISNCDNIIHTNYHSIYEFHKEGSHDLTVVGSLQQYTIPYGVCEIDNFGILKEIREKPEYDFLVNTGLYLMNPNVLHYIPEDKYFDMTDLIKVIQKESLKIGVYPVSEKSWIDVGQWSKYSKTIKELES